MTEQASEKLRLGAKLVGFAKEHDLPGTPAAERHVAQDNRFLREFRVTVLSVQLLMTHC